MLMLFLYKFYTRRHTRRVFLVAINTSRFPSPARHHFSSESSQHRERERQSIYLRTLVIEQNRRSTDVLLDVCKSNVTMPSYTVHGYQNANRQR